MGVSEIRRVYAAEALRRSGWADTWLRRQCRMGNFPPPRYDTGGRRRWWLADEIDEALTALTSSASGTPKLSGAAARGASAGTPARLVSGSAGNGATSVHTTAPSARKPAKKAARRETA